MDLSNWISEGTIVSEILTHSEFVDWSEVDNSNSEPADRLEKLNKIFEKYNSSYEATDSKIDIDSVFSDCEENEEDKLFPPHRFCVYYKLKFRC